MRYTNISEKITDNFDFHRKQFQIKQTVFENTKTCLYVNLSCGHSGVKALSYSVYDYVQCTNCSVEKVPQGD